MSCRMLTAMTTRGFLPLFREKMLRLEDRRSVVFSVSAAVPAPQQLHGRREMLSDIGDRCFLLFSFRTRQLTRCLGRCNGS